MDDDAPTPGLNESDSTSAFDLLDEHDRPDQTGPMPTAATPWYDVPLARQRTDRKVGGVLSGICRAHGFDVRTTRIAFAVVALVLPVLVFAYIAAWVVLPEEPAHPVSPRQLVTERQRRPLIVAIGVLLVAVLLGSVGSWWWFGDFPWGLGLIGGGVLLWLLSNRRTAATPPASPAPPAAPSAATVEPTLDSGTTVPQAARPDRSSRRRWPIASITLVAVALFGVVAQVGETLDWWQIEATTAILVGLATLLTATVVSAIVNHSVVLLVASAALAGIVGAVAVADPDLDGPIGDRSVRLAAGSNTDIHWQQAIGRLQLDLRDLDLSRTADPVTITATVGVGQLEVIVHEDVIVDFSGAVNIGHILVYNDEVASGVRVHHDVLAPAADRPVAGTVHLQLDVGVGEITVVRTDAER